MRHTFKFDPAAMRDRLESVKGNHGISDAEIETVMNEDGYPAALVALAARCNLSIDWIVMGNLVPFPEYRIVRRQPAA